jgi:hypothetical protein
VNVGIEPGPETVRAGELAPQLNRTVPVVGVPAVSVVQSDVAEVEMITLGKVCVKSEAP